MNFFVEGRPAPQGSKDGNMREQSVYLPSWRAAIKKRVYEIYKAWGVREEDLPYFRGPVEFACTFQLHTGQRIDSPPDLDKLLRAVWDALTLARVWEDDGRVVKIHHLEKREASEARYTGADITIYGTTFRGASDEQTSN